MSEQESIAVIGHNDAPDVPEFEEFERLLGELRAKYDGVEYDLDDPAVEREARSARLRLGKAIADLDRAHQSVKAPLLEKTRIIDGARKRIKDQMAAIQEGIKAQLAAKAQRETDRVAALDSRLAAIRGLACALPQSSEEIGRLLREAESVELDESWQEKKADAALAKTEAVAELTAALENARKAEAEAAELERLRQEAEARKRAEREEAIRKAAEEHARRVAEEAARKEAESAERRRERERQAEAARLAEERRQREAAEKAAKDAELRAKAQAEAAAKAERDRIARERQAEAARAEKARLADERKKAQKAHREKIEAEAVGALARIVSRECAADIVAAIARREIDHVELIY